MLHIQKEAALRPLFACGAYENICLENIGKGFGGKLLILAGLGKMVCL